MIFTLTPYIADSYHERGAYFAKNGYVFVTVDARGRGNSEGRFEPFLNEGRDGHDIAEWLAVQPWCNSKELDRVVGNPSPHFQMRLDHPDTPAFWEKLALTPDEYQKVNIPILTITGHYDGDQPGAMCFYRSHQQHGLAQARERHYLVIGPWDHAGTRTPAKEFGGLKFGDASMVDLNQLHKQWYDWTMKSGEKPDLLKQRVAYYVMGAEEWKYAESLEAIPTTRRRFYLNSAGHANDVFHSGTLSQAPPGMSTPDRYTYDPLDVRPAEIEREEIKDYLVDQRYALNLFGSGLIYHSEPFEADTEIAGSLKLMAWMSLDVPDTDFAVDVYEIMPSGMSILLTQDMLRARYRESLKEAQRVTPGEINRYEFKSFPYFSRRVAKGSRLRLVIRAPNSVYVQKNYNSGGDVSVESVQDARTAHVTLYHDAERPSHLELPVAR